MEDILKVLSALDLTEPEHQQLKLLYYECENNLIEFDSFQLSFSTLTDNEERVRCLQSQESYRNFIHYLTEHCKSISNYDKDVDRATKLRIDGNKAFLKKHYQKALNLYTEAIRYAPDNIAVDALNSGELSFAYGNRSAVFFCLDRYEDALKDIDAALTLGYGRHRPVTKLMLRKCECLLKLGNAALAKEVLDLVKINDAFSPDCAHLAGLYKLVDKGPKSYVLCQKNKFPKNIASVIKVLSGNGRFQPQSEFSSLSTKVAIACDSENGRHLVATEDIHFGEILAVTEPYAFTMSKTQEGHFCHHCLAPLTNILVINKSSTSKFVSRSVPCGRCTRVLYCSEHCRNKSWESYHQAECPMLPILHQFSNFSRSNHLALRTFFLAGGVNSICKVTQKIVSERLKDDDIDLAEPNHYEHVFQMKLKSDKYVPMKTKDIIRHTFVACLLVELTKIIDIRFFADGRNFIYKLFVKCFNFMKNLANFNSNENNEDEIFASSILLRHLEQIYSHCSVLTKSSSLPAICDTFIRFPDYKVESFQTVHPLIGLVKGSCEPNISIISVDSDGSGQQSNVVVFFAIRPLSAGSKLTAILSEYGGGLNARFQNYKVEATKIWKTDLLPCSCEQCVMERSDMPPLANFHYLPIPCSHCRGLLTRKSVTDQSYHCSDCSREYPIRHIQSAYWRLKPHALEASEKFTTLSDGIDLVRAHLLLEQLDELVTKQMARFLHRGSLFLSDHYRFLFHAHLKFAFEKNQPTKIVYREICIAWKLANDVITIIEHHYGKQCIPILVNLMEIVGVFECVFDDFDILLKSANTETYSIGKLEWIMQFGLLKERMQQMNDLYNMV